MGISARNTQASLPDFQKYLLEHKLIPANRVTFYAYWVSRFLSYARKLNVNTTEYHEQTASSFLEELRLDAGQSHQNVR